jgi:tRNA(fMet)-specific endonuclease VapC
MTPVVVDTDVVSFLFKSDSRAQLYLPLLKDRWPLISFMTEAELEQWILLAKWGESRVRRFQVTHNPKDYQGVPGLNIFSCA